MHQIGDQGIERLHSSSPGAFCFRQFDALHLFEFFDPALNLFRLRRLIAKSIDKYLKLLNAFTLIAVCGFQLLLPLSLLRQILFVIAAIRPDLLVPDFDNPIHRHVQKITVMRNQDQGEGILGKVLLQPIAGLKVQMVRGFVQQQKIRFLQE